MSTTELTLAEYETVNVSAADLDFEQGVDLWRRFDHHGKKLRVAFPSPKNEQQWQLSALGWVGHIPVDNSVSIRIEPKTTLPNIFRMWETVYELRPYALSGQLATVATLSGFYERIVLLLVERVQLRLQRGLYRTYERQESKLGAIRGKMLHPASPTTTGPPRVTCQYRRQAVDIIDNQILTYTLTQVAAGRRCRPALQGQVRRLAHQLQRLTTGNPITPEACVGRPYHRLNDDYAAMHALCRFLLAQQGPFLQRGPQPMLPFLFNMAHLYERFVAVWLQAHLPPQWQLRLQETVTFGRAEEVRFDVDMVLYDGDGRVAAVLDTKYKTDSRAANADISQVATYAQAKATRHAFLVYPEPLAATLDVHIQHLQVHSLTFALDGDLDENGHAFMHELISLVTGKGDIL